MMVGGATDTFCAAVAAAEKEVTRPKNHLEHIFYYSKHLMCKFCARRERERQKKRPTRPGDNSSGTECGETLLLLITFQICTKNKK